MTCQLVERRDNGGAPVWDSIHRTDHWDVVHSYNTAIEGWLVLVLRRHLPAVADLTEEEASELGLLLKDVSSALRAVTGCVKTYVAQFAEDPDHPHVHVHVVPRLVDHPPETLGPNVFQMLTDNVADQVSPDRRNELAMGIRESLLAD